MQCTYKTISIITYSYVLEMQRYIDISLYYRDKLGSDTVIDTYLGRIDISNIVIYQIL